MECHNHQIFFPSYGGVVYKTVYTEFSSHPIQIQDSAVQIADLNSKFGTFINGVKVSPQSKHLLRHNDEIRFGQSPITGRFK